MRGGKSSRVRDVFSWKSWYAIWKEASHRVYIAIVFRREDLMKANVEWYDIVRNSWAFREYIALVVWEGTSFWGDFEWPNSIYRGIPQWLSLSVIDQTTVSLLKVPIGQPPPRPNPTVVPQRKSLSGFNANFSLAKNAEHASVMAGTLSGPSSCKDSFYGSLSLCWTYGWI